MFFPRAYRESHLVTAAAKCLIAISASFRQAGIWEKWKKIYFHNIGYIYDYQRLNNMNPEALILSNSDQLINRAALDSAAKCSFHIGAITEMSGHLMAHRYPNVLPSKYSSSKVVELEMWLVSVDINISDEILNACRTAFENNMLDSQLQKYSAIAVDLLRMITFTRQKNTSTMVDKTKLSLLTHQRWRQHLAVTEAGC